MAEDLLLDPAIRDWVPELLLVVIVIIGILLYFVGKLMRSLFGKIVREGQLILRARTLRAVGGFIQGKSFRSRRFYYTNEVH